MTDSPLAATRDALTYYSHGLAIGPASSRRLISALAELDAAERINAALTKLVALKDGPRDGDYIRRKPDAWDEARAALAALRVLEGEPG